MGAVGWTQGGPEQDFHRFGKDFGTRVLITRSLKFHFVRLASTSFSLFISESTFRRLGLRSRGFRKESIAKVDFSWKSFIKNFEINFLFDAVGSVFLIF